MGYSSEAVHEITRSGIYSLAQITEHLGREDFTINVGKDRMLTQLTVSFAEDGDRRRVSVSRVMLDRIKTDQSHPLIGDASKLFLPQSQSISLEEETIKGHNGGTQRTLEVQRNEKVIYRSVVLLSDDTHATVRRYNRILPWDTSWLMEMAASVTTLTDLAVQRRGTGGDYPTFP